LRPIGHRTDRFERALTPSLRRENSSTSRSEPSSPPGPRGNVRRDDRRIRLGKGRVRECLPRFPSFPVLRIWAEKNPPALTQGGNLGQQVGISPGLNRHPAPRPERDFLVGLLRPGLDGRQRAGRRARRGARCVQAQAPAPARADVLQRTARRGRAGRDRTCLKRSPARRTEDAQPPGSAFSWQSAAATLRRRRKMCRSRRWMMSPWFTPKAKRDAGRRPGKKSTLLVGQARSDFDDARTASTTLCETPAGRPFYGVLGTMRPPCRRIFGVDGTSRPDRRSSAARGRCRSRPGPIKGAGNSRTDVGADRLPRGAGPAGALGQALSFCLPGHVTKAWGTANSAPGARDKRPSILSSKCGQQERAPAARRSTFEVARPVPGKGWSGPAMFR